MAATSRRNCAATFDGADGVVLVKGWMISLPAPPRLRGCGRFAAFLLRAATPPQLRRGAALTQTFLLIWTAVSLPLRFDMLVDPVDQQIGQIQVVPILHQHVTVAFDPKLRQIHHLRVATRGLQLLHKSLTPFI